MNSLKLEAEDLTGVLQSELPTCLLHCAPTTTSKWVVTVNNSIDYTQNEECTYNEHSRFSDCSSTRVFQLYLGTRSIIPHDSYARSCCLHSPCLGFAYTTSLPEKMLTNHILPITRTATRRRGFVLTHIRYSEDEQRE